MEHIGEPFMVDLMSVESVAVHIPREHAKAHLRCHHHILISIHIQLSGVTYAKNLATMVHPIAFIGIQDHESEWDLQHNNRK